MTWRGKSVLVTGASGFIGSHLTERLVELGARTRAFVHYNAQGGLGWLEDSPARDEIDIIAGDVTDRGSLQPAFDDVEIVFHLAALIAIPYSYRSPASYVRTNIEGTLNVLQCARDAGVARVVHTSTSEVYGTARSVPIDESHPLQGQSPYSASKIGADKIAEAFHLSFNVPVVTVRPFNTFGPRQSTRAIIPTIVTQALTGEPVKLGSLSPKRDLTYVSDTVSGFLAAATAPGAVGRTINIGSGREIAIGDLVHLIGGLLGSPVRVVLDETRVRPVASEVDRLMADNTLARTLLGWSPAVTVEAGLERTIDWLRSHAGRYRANAYAI
jgi:dTDP-glucose 4,6-dehydratase